MRCMVHSDVGVRCAECAPPLQVRRPVLTRATCRQAAGGTGTLFLVIIGISVLSRLVLRSGGDDDGYAGGYSDSYSGVEAGWDYDLTVGEIVDPWMPAEGDAAPAAGFRFVAIEVTIATSRENERSYPTGTYDFKLSDDEQFAYGPLTTGAEPMFPEDVELEPGERVRGWVTFEVAELRRLESLTSYEETVSLVDEVAATP